MSSIDTLLANNRKYAASFLAGNLPGAPAGKIAIVTCMDARIETGTLLGLKEGDAHIIRNAGGIVTDDVIRSLMISQHLLGTREVMLIQHTQCGMMTFSDEELKNRIEKESGSRPHFDIGSFTHLEQEIRNSVIRIKETPLIPHTDSVRGFIYDVENGTLQEIN